MKKAIAISFIVLFLCANTEIGQLLKFPVLMHHFLAHEEEHDTRRGLSFADFIRMHYSNAEHHPEKSSHEHKNLPFKTLNQNTNIVLAFEVPEAFTFQRHLAIPGSSPIGFERQLYTSGLFSNVWLPPKLS